MTYRAHIKNGQIVLDEPATFPEGAEVVVDVITSTDVLSKVADLSIEGKLPPDYSQQHDHYIKGTPRK